ARGDGGDSLRAHDQVRDDIEAVRHDFGSPFVLQASEEQLVEVWRRTLTYVDGDVTKAEVLLERNSAAHVSVACPGDHRVRVLKQGHFRMPLGYEYLGGDQEVESAGLQGLHCPLTRRHEFEGDVRRQALHNPQSIRHEYGDRIVGDSNRETPARRCRIKPSLRRDGSLRL